MRLIDADALIEVIRKQKVDNDAYCKMCIETMAEIVDEQPTAYNPEKVVEELEERSKEYNSGVRLHGKPEEMLTHEAINIVRGGVE